MNPQTENLVSNMLQGEKPENQDLPCVAFEGRISLGPWTGLQAMILPSVHLSIS